MLNPYRVNEHREALAMVRDFRTRGTKHGNKMAAEWLRVAGEIRRNAWKPWDMERLIWVCQCCTFSHAHGECCDGSHDQEPWSLMRSEDSVAMGGAEHRPDCDNSNDCGCGFESHSTRRCGGCGTYDHGERHAFTVFVNDRRNTPVAA